MYRTFKPDESGQIWQKFDNKNNNKNNNRVNFKTASVILACGQKVMISTIPWLKKEKKCVAKFFEELFFPMLWQIALTAAQPIFSTLRPEHIVFRTEYKIIILRSKFDIGCLDFEVKICEKRFSFWLTQSNFCHYFQNDRTVKQQ